MGATSGQCQHGMDLHLYRPADSLAPVFRGGCDTGQDAPRSGSRLSTPPTSMGVALSTWSQRPLGGTKDSLRATYWGKVGIHQYEATGVGREVEEGKLSLWNHPIV